MTRTVLIVDDNDCCTDVLEIALLTIPEVVICTVGSAHEALGRLDQDPSVAALITDLHMPKIDGFELISRVRSDDRHGRLPIMVISGDSDRTTPDRVRRLGADAYFTKPYSPQAVRHALEQLLHPHPK